MAPTFYDDKTNKPYVSKNFPHMEELIQQNIKKFRQELKHIAPSYVIRPRMKVLGEGIYSIVIRCSEDEVVMKLMDNDDNFIHEVEMLRYMNKHTKKTTSPLCPRFYKAFTVNEKFGVILMQHVKYVFKKSLDMCTYTSKHYKLLQRTLKRLHTYGVNHGDLKPEHIYIFTLPNDKYKLCFIDYGVSYKISDRPMNDTSRLYMLSQ